MLAPLIYSQVLQVCVASVVFRADSCSGSQHPVSWWFREQCPDQSSLQHLEEACSCFHVVQLSKGEPAAPLHAGHVGPSPGGENLPGEVCACVGARL